MRMSVSRPRMTNASTCSPSFDQPAILVASSMSSGRSGTGRPSDRHARDPQGRVAVADGDTLAVLAARTGRAHGEVVADHVDVLEDLGAVADEVGVPDRVGDLAVLDHVRLGHPEDEVAGGGVDLAAAELGDVDAVGRVPDDGLRVVRAVGDE